MEIELEATFYEQGWEILLIKEDLSNGRITIPEEIIMLKKSKE